ncbi:hypothetical protein A3A39_00895 [Candidatus Kaiserbacteria bacterium RIFCSPLOWO2_01_FULL_54_13]|uniref:Plasmid stabilization protein n=1 Tax=Candidatus Kaiserbacteria bacterium RIFCSPLOWO2_01_FULL_54_13 TaxID=1798512 RepID=A0A1F6F1T7_9BACT|nr:MAG: hypothetical protein A3A39_00895 [Candidatus Kaiserbacteria bacterium RIFCSPLOWO2_01_FULL_54_13]
MYTILQTSSARRQYKKLPRDVAENVAKLFTGEFAEDPFSSTLDIVKLKVPISGYRIRAGDYRILYTVEKKQITVYSIKHRKDAYRR